ncbi:MAG: c-type cytochrome [Bordetella sp.]|nr:MAG: c-type cytochrome [Bordetella sp.]
MRKKFKSVILLLSIVTNNLFANDANLILAKNKNCMTCHKIDKKYIGPPFNAISARYLNKEENVIYLMQKIKKGSQGSWGAIPMPAQTNITKEESKELAIWILKFSQKKLNNY